MSQARDIRRAAFQAIFELDARGESDAETVRAGVLESSEEMRPADAARAFELALAAFRDRARADAVMVALAPGWPAHRQAAVDRAILRLAHYEMTSGRTPPKVAVNEAVELAKEYSTDKSPSFVNALLDKVLRQVLGGVAGDGATDLAAGSSDALSPIAPDESLS